MPTVLAGVNVPSTVGVLVAIVGIRVLGKVKPWLWVLRKVERG